ncbi:MAG TPA: transporter substrate-binding domain-containing protein [Pseudonocardiaceae bacterium]|nr:transporter substrate-binding domain-containing protein [Pseudonocardiaceae bacterium]
MTATLTRRRFGVATIAIAAAFSLAACGGATSSSSANNQLGTKVAGQITFAFRSDDKPASFVQDGKPTGFLVELAQAMAAKMGVTANFVATDFDSMLPNVRNHKYDSAAFDVLITPARKQVVDFTTAVNYSEARLISRKSAPVSSIQAAGTKTVAVTTGSSLIPILQKQATGVTVKEFPNIAASANALEAGQVDGLFTGVATTAQLLTAHPDFTATQEINTGESAFPVAPDKQALLKSMNSALAAVIADGTYTKLFAKWNPPNLLIPQGMLTAYPGLKQR